MTGATSRRAARMFTQEGIGQLTPPGVPSTKLRRQLEKREKNCGSRSGMGARTMMQATVFPPGTSLTSLGRIPHCPVTAVFFPLLSSSKASGTPGPRLRISSMTVFSRDGEWASHILTITFRTKKDSLSSVKAQSPPCTNLSVKTCAIHWNRASVSASTRSTTVLVSLRLSAAMSQSSAHSCVPSEPMDMKTSRRWLFLKTFMSNAAWVMPLTNCVF
mmetsp:Transcript_14448/g.38318  ORF Transcript_14448/g.38318 Transcript_14448/m.38318 type:complete len:217 (-) Transcript_14448:899-1549(-)